VVVCFAAFLGCTNNPYREGEAALRTYFTSYSAAPNKLDPANAYYPRENRLVDQVCEPPFTYHYLKRPYQLVPLTADTVPQPVYFDGQGERIDSDDPPADQVNRVEYTIGIKRGVRYQNHPCFARDDEGRPLYANVSPEDVCRFDSPARFTHLGTRDVLAKDYLLQICRLADPRNECPVYSTIQSYVLGLDGLRETFKAELASERERRRQASGGRYNQEQSERLAPIKLNYEAYPCDGLQLIDDYTFKIVLKRKYPQILYWMAMHFFAPTPREAIDFYAQPAVREKLFTLRRYPVGSGPYYFDTCRPEKHIILKRNPNYRADLYPETGLSEDGTAGRLRDAGKPLPFIDTQVWTLEKEAIPGWSKFLQGYYDDSDISSDVFDQAVQFQAGADATLSEDMKARGIEMTSTTRMAFYYTKFNMLDETVGGLIPQKCALRRAISIVLDPTEYLDIFRNGRGVPASGPLPPGIFGHRDGPDGINPFVDDWDPKRNRPRRKSLETARALMEEAGYPDGRCADGTALTLHLDHSGSGDPTFRSRLQWMQRRLGLLGIHLKERGTEVGRYRDKLRQGSWQLIRNVWFADYPDPENLLFLFYGPNGKVKHSGYNMSNYRSPAFDALFEELETMANGPQRQKLIDNAIRLLQHDAPAVWEYYPLAYMLTHSWYTNVKPAEFNYNVRKYHRINPELRVTRQKEWNRPVLWPVVAFVVLIVVAGMPTAVRHSKRHQRERLGTASPSIPGPNGGRSCAEPRLDAAPLPGEDEGGAEAC